MNILVTNDDGIHAPGLDALARAARRFGNVSVVAPVHEQSGVGHGVTLLQPLRAVPVHRNGGLFGHAVSGTPADCVKLVLTSSICPRPDLIFSGVNFGRNTGIHILYSGTVAAAIEGAILGVPSVAISVDFSAHPRFDEAAAIACEVIKPYVRRVREAQEVPQALNVNVPALPRGRIRGARVTAQCGMAYAENMERRLDPRGRHYYWLTGGDDTVEVEAESDLATLRQRFVTVTPLHFDMTDRRWLERLTPGDLGPIAESSAEE